MCKVHLWNFMFFLLATLLRVRTDYKQVGKMFSAIKFVVMPIYYCLFIYENSPRNNLLLQSKRFWLFVTFLVHFSAHLILQSLHFF